MLSNVKELENIAESWIRCHQDKDCEGTELDFTLPEISPEKCLDVIIIILEKIDPLSDHQLFTYLAVGPLEDLLHDNGKTVVDRVEILVRQNRVFRQLLNEVWDSEIDKNVKNKLSKYIDK